MEDKKGMDESTKLARERLKKRFPRIAKVLTELYILKKNMIILFVLIAFFCMLNYGVQRTIINWGFFSLFICLVFGEIILVKNNMNRMRLLLWQVMSFYATVIIILNIAVLFFQKPNVQDFRITQFLKMLLP